MIYILCIAAMAFFIYATSLVFLPVHNQYIVESLSRIRGSSVRLKSILKRGNGVVSTAASAVTAAEMSKDVTSSPGASQSGKHNTPGLAGKNNSSSFSASGNLKSASRGSFRGLMSTSATTNASVGNSVSNVGDLVLVDLLLEELDFDLFLRVEAHYIRALQLKVFRAWSAAVEDVDGNLMN